MTNVNSLQCVNYPVSKQQDVKNLSGIVPDLQDIGRKAGAVVVVVIFGYIVYKMF